MSYSTITENTIREIVDWIRRYFVENGPDSKAVIGISGGKDSTICAALLCKALGPERVVTVQMPDGPMEGMGTDVINYLKIPETNRYVYNISTICKELANTIGNDIYHDNKQICTNAPARIRMTVLYAVAAMVGGRVCNTCNKSEDYVGYSTKFGDAAGDFSLLKEYTVEEVKNIGFSLGLPSLYVNVPPSDGLCGKTDEENLGFKYSELDKYLMTGEIPDNFDTYVNIKKRHERNKHKLEPMPYAPYARGF